MNEILKIIAECNKNRELLSIDDVKKICHTILSRNHYDFVKDIYFLKSYPDGSECGGAFCLDKIFFFSDGINQMLNSYLDKFTDKYVIDGSEIDIINYYYLIIIFHELAHARQYYLSTRLYNSPEKKLFSFFGNIGSNSEFYKNNYSDLMIEVNANNVSHLAATYLYSKLPINFVTNDDKNTYQSVMLSNFLYENYTIDPYKEVVVSPSERISLAFTDEILEKNNMSIEKYANLIYNDKFTLYKKLMLGLPISYLEYAYVKLLIDLMPMGENINVIKKLQKKVHE